MLQLAISPCRAPSLPGPATARSQLQKAWEDPQEGLDFSLKSQLSIRFERPAYRMLVELLCQLFGILALHRLRYEVNLGTQTFCSGLVMY